MDGGGRGGRWGWGLCGRWVALKQDPSAGSVSSRLRSLLRDLSSLFTVSPAVSAEVGYWSSGPLTVMVLKEREHQIPPTCLAGAHELDQG